MMENQELWEKICTIQASLKKVVLKVEQISSEQTLVQVALEQRNALDHVIRAKSRELIIAEVAEPSEEDRQYIRDNFDKALGHVYRGFFDACDWSNIVLREKITQTLKGYSNECICTVIPTYYPEIRPKLDELSSETASIRESKDIANGNEIIPQVRKYEESVLEMIRIVQSIDYKVPALEQYAKGEKTSNMKSLGIKIALLVLAALLGGWITNLFGKS